MGAPDYTHPLGTILYLTLQQCDTGECCVQQYTVCRVSRDSVTMIPMGISMFPTSALCSFEPDSIIVIGPWGLPIGSLPNGNCHTTCDWVVITNPEVIVLPEKAAASSNDNNTGDKITINCTSEQICNLRIEYFDLQGILIYSYRKTLQNTVNDLDITSLIDQKGFIVYRVYVNDLIVKTGKIIK
jgi:hypothetical protein